VDILHYIFQRNEDIAVKKALNIAVLYGGDGPERQVSLKSGQAVIQALRDAAYKVEPFDVKSIEQLMDLKSSKFDSVFIALHGSWGEDGRVQSVLETMKLPYTGSGPLACCLSMDKAASKGLLNLFGISTPEGVLVLKDSDYSLEKANSFVQKHGTIVVKPCNGGSTLGVTIVSEGQSLSQALCEAWKYDTRCILEKYIEGVDVAVTVWNNNGSLEALPSVMICPEKGFYDYDSKYTPGMTRYIVPAPFMPTVNTTIATMACRTFETLSCDGYARIDFRVEEDGTPWVLEVNTAPGMTGTSLVPKAAAAAGYDFSTFLSKIVSLSFDKKGVCR
jgi:D-alanine-D-alanine ligase